MTLVFLAHQAICGAIAAAGFGVLFNFGCRFLGWCAASGAVALGVRTCCLGLGLNLEGASFAAALVVSAAAEVLEARTDISTNVLDVVGCIPMVPGSFAAKAIIGLFALTTSSVTNVPEVLSLAVQQSLRVLFTIVAIGTGLAIPRLLLRVRVPR
jgi:uncharacterized membrane protein YjjB (DUF3815 family)